MDGNLQLNLVIFRPYGHLISVHMDGNQALNFAIFRPYER